MSNGQEDPASDPIRAARQQRATGEEFGVFTPETLAAATPLDISGWLHDAGLHALGVNEEGFVKWVWKGGKLIGSSLRHQGRKQLLASFPSRGWSPDLGSFRTSRDIVFPEPKKGSAHPEAPP